jgi:hypothetical protein
MLLVGNGRKHGVMTVVRAADRFVTTGPGTTTRSVLSTGRHWDPARLPVGPLVALDEHKLGPGAGFPPHRHRGLTIVTAVVEGALLHDGRDLVTAGAVLEAGAGVEHSEVAGPDGCRFWQAWLSGDAEGAPSYRLGGGVLTGPVDLTAAPALVVVTGEVEVGGVLLRPGDTALRAPATAVPPGAGVVHVTPPG